MSTHNLCFRAKMRKMYTPVNPSFTIPQFYNIKLGCKGVYMKITRTCYPDYCFNKLKALILLHA